MRHHQVTASRFGAGTGLPRRAQGAERAGTPSHGPTVRPDGEHWLHRQPPSPDQGPRAWRNSQGRSRKKQSCLPTPFLLFQGGGSQQSGEGSALQPPYSEHVCAVLSLNCFSVQGLQASVTGRFLMGHIMVMELSSGHSPCQQTKQQGHRTNLSGEGAVSSPHRDLFPVHPCVFGSVRCTERPA